MSDEAKPVLWVSMTETGRSDADAESMASLQEDLKETYGDEYNVVVADDRVRLATQEDLRALRNSIDDLLPSDLETQAEQEERKREELGLSTEAVMGGDTDAPGVQEPADEAESDTDDDA